MTYMSGALTQENPQPIALAEPLLSQAKKAADRFNEDLLKAEVNSPTFQARLNEAFAFGKTQVAHIAGLMTGQFAKKFAAGTDYLQAYSALNAIHTQLQALDPGKQGDLSTPHKFLGFIPYGNKLKTYFKQFEAARLPLERSLRQLYAARDDIEHDEVELDRLSSKLSESLTRLTQAIVTARELQTQVSETIASLQNSDSAKATLIEQNVLYHLRQNLQDMLTQQVLSLQATTALEVLKKTGRELQNACTRVATTGISALAVAQVVARANGHQLKLMELLQGTTTAVEELMLHTSRQLAQHTDRTSSISSMTADGIQKMQLAFNDAFQAIDSMATLRSEALTQIKNTGIALREQLEKVERYTDNTKAS